MTIFDFVYKIFTSFSGKYSELTWWIKTLIWAIIMAILSANLGAYAEYRDTLPFNCFYDYAVFVTSIVMSSVFGTISLGLLFSIPIRADNH